MLIYMAHLIIKITSNARVASDTS